ncbi:TetR/AcrR family transcriptional regulator [Streptomyces sp. NPDC005970]|uniref:TetR/AcrR family transcriptional regulator n=1 Tax=Streptomyces sp. NPDC005970 TaxID=3156723 RepID=UPI003400CCD3
MAPNEQGRSARKHEAIMEAATAVFMEKGYSGTSMDDIARLAAVSKQTVYKHFADKEKLFAEIVLATSGRIDGMIDLVAAIPADPDALEDNLHRLARQFRTFRRLADEGLLRVDEPLLAANHFSGLLLWIPVNKAMFTGGPQHTEADLDHYATAGVRAFLAAYR